MAHEALFWGVCRECVCSGEIRDLEAVASITAIAAFGADGDAAVIADVLVSARNGVEERRLAAVGVSDEGDGDGPALAREDLFDRRAAVVGFISVVAGLLCFGIGLWRFISGCGQSDPFGPSGQIFVGFAVGEDLDHFGLGSSQRDVVSHDPVFDGVFERGVQDHLDALSAHESHLHDAASESSVAHDLDDRGGFAAFEFGKTHFLRIFQGPKIRFYSDMGNPEFQVSLILCRCAEPPEGGIPVSRPFRDHSGLRSAICRGFGIVFAAAGPEMWNPIPEKLHFSCKKTRFLAS